MNNLLIQFVAGVALTAFAGSFHSKTRKGILFWQVVSLLAWTGHYAFLSAWTAAFLTSANVFITVFFIYKDSKCSKRWNNPLILYSSLFILLVVTFATWRGYYSLFALLGISSITVAKWQKQVQHVRFISVLASIFWIIYDLFVGSWGGVVVEVIILISIAVSLIRYKSV